MDFLPHELIRIYRLRKGLTQEGMAIHLDCSQMQISRYERGFEPNENDKIKIEKMFGVKIWERGGREKCKI